jgi:hypothetical protein
MSSYIAWRAYEYMHIPKSSDWFWALGIITLSIAGASIIFGNIIFALMIIIASVALGIHAVKEPRMIDVELSEKGIRIEKVFYPYKTLESFCVEQHETDIGIFAKILIKSKKTMMPLMVIPIAEVHPDDIHEYLSIFLVEEEHQETIGEKLMEWLGF